MHIQNPAQRSAYGTCICLNSVQHSEYAKRMAHDANGIYAKGVNDKSIALSAEREGGDPQALRALCLPCTSRNFYKILENNPTVKGRV